jgi:hypothetical protein
LTVTRGIDGTTGVSHSLGAVVRHDHSARDFAESRAHEAATSGVHGTTGALVGATQAMALTNKDLSSGTNTFPASLATDTDVSTAVSAEAALRSSADSTNATAISDHLADTVDAHDASAISFSPTGTIAATDVQAAVAEAASEAVQKALADAKGDLIVATANDTFARKAVGSNGAILVADSAQSDGLRWTTSLNFEGSGSPEGVVTAPVSSSYRDTTNGTWYIKATGSGNTGWLVASTGNPSVVLSASGTTSIPHNAYTKVALDTTDYIDGGSTFYTFSGGVVTIVQDGTYNFNYSAAFATSPQLAVLEFSLRENGIGGAARGKVGISSSKALAASPALNRFPVSAGTTYQIGAYHFQESGSSAVNAASGARLVIEKVA